MKCQEGTHKRWLFSLKVLNLLSSSILHVEQQKLTGFSFCVNFMRTSFCLLFMTLVDSFHDQRRVFWMRTLVSPGSLAYM